VIEKQAKLVFLALSMGTPYTETALSLKFLHKYLKERLDFPIEFHPSLKIEGFQ
jgi:hypothetical protein